MLPGLSPEKLEAARPTGRSGNVPMGAKLVISSRKRKEFGDLVSLQKSEILPVTRLIK